VTLDVHSYRIRLRARQPLVFSHAGPGNLLRGAFGSALYSTSAYRRIFAPVSTRGPSGLVHPPRPFVFRVSHLAGRTLAPGEMFCFDINFFTARESTADFLAGAFTGFAKAELDSVEAAARISLALEPRAESVHQLHVAFLTPTQLQRESNASTRAAEPDFSVLFARARDRVSTLRSLYGPGPLDIDFRAMGHRARAIRIAKCDLRRVSAVRRSRRTGQSHSIGGFVGQVEYQGDLTEFLPILEAARWTGVGRHCVWGNGEILARPL